MDFSADNEDEGSGEPVEGSEEDRELKEQFGSAADFVRSIAGKLQNDDLLYLYARYKQANDGPCNEPRPGMFDFKGKQKWDAWKKLGAKGRRDSMQEYVEALNNIDPDWEEKMDSGKVKRKSGMGAAVSTLHNTDALLADDCKTVFDWCKEGNGQKVGELLGRQRLNVNQLDESGLALLHWACDRGNEAMVETMLSFNADINIRDAEGQTPLHYAASCEHESIVRLLVSRGADTSVTDESGVLPLECTDCAGIRALIEGAPV